MSESVYDKLSKFFCKNQISIKEFYSIVKKQSKKEQLDTLFKFINNQINNYNGKRNQYMIVNAIGFINVLFKESQSIDKSNIKRSLLKLQAKVVELSNNGIYNTKLILCAIEKQIDSLNNDFSIKKYDLLESIIENSTNIDYIEKTFIDLDNSVNEKDKLGNSLFYNLVSKYIKTIKKGKDSKERLLYYNNIMLLMKSHLCFQLSKDEKKACLNMVYSFLGTLNSNTRDYQFKKAAINRLKETILSKSACEIENISQLASKYNVNINFNTKVLNATKSAKYVYDRKRTRIKDYIISIDGENAVEIDDGLSVQKISDGTYLLGTHIASPLSYIEVSSPVIKEAINRTSSIYTNKKMRLFQNEAPTSVFTMFPNKFLTEMISLNSRQIRNAKSYYFRIDSSGDIIESRFLQSVIRNYKQCSYQEVNNILQNGCNNEQLLYTVNTLQEVSEILSKRIKPEEIYECKKNNDVNPSRLKVGNSLAELIVSRTMVLTGSEVATYFADNGYPLLYRVHEVSDADIEKLKTELNLLSIKDNRKTFNKLYSKLLHLYPRARYDLEGSHYGLGLEHYCHCTSPARRAADIVNERALDVCYFSNPSDKDIYNLDDFIRSSKDTINRQNDNISMFLNEYVNIKTKLKK